jgi:prepilin peptidase CpaA
MTAQVWIAVLVGLAATIDDLARRRIANWIPAAALAGGLVWQIGQHGWRGGIDALEGAAAGFAVFLIFYLVGGMGGGDIKLMAGFGALLGVSQVLWAALLTAGVGGVLALCVIVVRSVRKMAGKAAGKVNTVSSGAGNESIPYAPAIALGVWLSLVPKG